jgi:hypothetical protein
LGADPTEHLEHVLYVDPGRHDSVSALKSAIEISDSTDGQRMPMRRYGFVVCILRRIWPITYDVR